MHMTRHKKFVQLLHKRLGPPARLYPLRRHRCRIASTSFLQRPSLSSHSLRRDTQGLYHGCKYQKSRLQSAAKLIVFQFHLDNKDLGNRESVEDWRSINTYILRARAYADLWITVRGINPLTPPDLLQHEIAQVHTPSSHTTAMSHNFPDRQLQSNRCERPS